MTEEKEKIINAFNNAWNKKIASENSYGKLASKEMFENKEEIINSDGTRNWEANILLDNIHRLEQERDELKKACEKCKLFDIEKTNRDLLERIDKLEQENKELKEEIQFHNKENSNLLAERNAAQIGYDEIREVRERYRSALKEIRDCLKDWDNDVYNPKELTDKINEVLQDKENKNV